MLIQPLNKIIEKRLSLFFYAYILTINIQQFASYQKIILSRDLGFEPSANIIQNGIKLRL
jgi:hypothetical protein